MIIHSNVRTGLEGVAGELPRACVQWKSRRCVRIRHNGKGFSSLCFVLTLAPQDAFLRAVQWAGARDYQQSARAIWKVAREDIEVAGYATPIRTGRFANRFVRVVVRNAGHLLPTDKPREAFDMIDRFISGRGFDN